MLAVKESEKLDDPEFKWGKKRRRGGKKGDVQFYDSFTYDEVDYSLYDCVYMYNEGEPAPYIGKLIKMWETAEGMKKVKVQWFFRPSEISYYLKDTKVLENELFFASGDGIGLSDLNPPEAIAGKCNVICTSTDRRNPQPLAEELQMADYVFYRTFDVKNCAISDQMDDKVGGLEVNFVFNRRECVRALDSPKIDSSEKNERNVVECVQTLKIAANSSPQQSNDMKLENNGNHTLVQAEKEMKKYARKSCDLDGAPSNRAKFDGSVSLDSNGVQGASVSKNDAAHLSTGAATSKGKLKSGLVKDPHAEDALTLQKNSKSNGNLNVSQGNISKTKAMSSALMEDLGSAHKKDSFVDEKDKKLGGNSSSFGEKSSETNLVSLVETQSPSKTNILPKQSPKSLPDKAFKGSRQAEKPIQSLPSSVKMPVAQESKEKSNLGHVKSSENKEGSRPAAKPFQSSSSSMKRKSQMSSEEYKEKSNLGHDKSYENKEISGKAIKPLQSSSTLMTRTLELSVKQSKEKSNLGHDKSLEKEQILDNTSYPKDGGYLKKAKLDSSIKQLEVNKNSKIKNSKENDLLVEKNNSPKCATSSDNNAKSKLDEEPSNGYCHAKAKINLGETKNLPKIVTHDNKAKSRLGEGPSKVSHNEKDGKLLNDNLLRGKNFEVTPKPPDKPTWMKYSWDELMKAAHDQGRLVLLLNLDPQYTSGEVEDIIWHTFQEDCTARMVPHTAISNPYSGQAFAVFKSRDVANRVVQKLDDECLMLPNQRPLVACHAVLPKSSDKQTSFVGHLVIDKDRRQIQRMQRDWKEALSTSHYSQHNTIEYTMAMDWCLLQLQSDKWWKSLHEQQRRDFKKLMENLKSN